PASSAPGAALRERMSGPIARDPRRPQSPQRHPPAAVDAGVLPAAFGPGTSDAPVSTQSLFVGLVLTAENGDVEAYLVNNTATLYERVLARTGMYAEMDDDLLESTVGVRKGVLPPFSALLLEASPWWERDYSIWYQLELQTSDSAKPVRVAFGIPNDDWRL